jgi:Ca-activated chloride channel family protein
MSAIRLVRVGLLLAFGAALLSTEAFFLAAPPTPQAEGKKSLAADEKAQALEEAVTQGALRIVKDDGKVVECPLRHTDVKAEVSGFIARVRVTQTFYNPTNERIEAVYVFPLPHEAAVDDMTMLIGQRKIVGLIKRRAEAKQIYQEALAAGQTAALLEQERPNIFTQSVGNIDPGQEVNIEISYVDVLGYDMGTYEFHFPMVVGPRFIPGQPVSTPQPNPPGLQGKVSPPVPDTTRVPDASRITPPVLKPGVRNGHDISLSLRLDAGVPIQDLKVVNHQADVARQGNSQAEVRLSPADSIPNKDFVLRYQVAGKKPEMAVLAHTGDYTDAKRLGRGYFMLMIQPKEDERLTKSPPREIVFLLDVSGSMSGQPTEKNKEAMREMLKLCREIDTVQVITFANQTQQLFDKPVPVNNQNIARALNFTQRIQGGGGTYMLEGVKRAIDQPKDPQRVRIVIMLTDGYIGNEAEIIEHVGKNCGDQIRFWAIGIGSSPNMFLIDGVAKQGGGMGKKLELGENAAGLAEEVISRIQRAQLAKIAIDWGGLNVAETYPAKIPELWAGRPVILFGRYRDGGPAQIKIQGEVEGQPVSWPLHVALPASQSSHDVLAKVWARKKIEDLMQQTYYQGTPAVEEEVTAIALDYRLMSQYTSFVAVDAKDAEKIGKERPAQPPRRMLVPVPLPEGTRWEGFFGPQGEDALEETRKLAISAEPRAKYKRSIKNHAYFGGQPGMGGGMGGMGFGAAAPMPSAYGPTSAAPAARPMAAAPARSISGPAPVARGRLQQASQIDRLGRVMARQPAKPQVSGFEGRATRSLGFRESPAMVPALEMLRQDLRGDVAKEAPMDDAMLRADGFTANALGPNTQPIVQAAQQLFEAGRKHQEKKNWGEAQANLVRAYFLATAAVNRGNYQGQPTADAALAGLQSLHADRVEAWKKQAPSLSKKLDLVLRDLSVDEALAAISKAAGLKIRLLEGSAEDASEVLAGRDVRVSYLDLRGASLADALDWLLQPLRLAWEPDEKAATILVGSDRRLPHVSAWVYDVSTTALPLPKEYGKTEDAAKAVATAQRIAETFVDSVRKSLGLSDKEVVWFAPGQLLLSGSPKTHAAAAQLFAQLADPRASLPASLTALHEKTGQRAKERDEQAQKLHERTRLADTAAAHDEYGWRLLAAALGGQLDLEALTELEIAWKADATKKLLAGSSAVIPLRSAWAVTASARLLPDEKELIRLADSVRQQAREAAAKAADVKDRTEEPSAMLAAVYGALALDEAGLRTKVLGAVSREPGPGSPAAGVGLAARGLLGEPLQVAPQQLGKLITEGAVTGEDAIVLVALACRRAGEPTWTAFRAEMQELVGNQPLPGSVVVLIHRLSGNVSPMFNR